jgi:hypothetical protein
MRAILSSCACVAAAATAHLLGWVTLKQTPASSANPKKKDGLSFSDRLLAKALRRRAAEGRDFTVSRWTTVDTNRAIRQHIGGWTANQSMRKAAKVIHNPLASLKNLRTLAMGLKQTGSDKRKADQAAWAKKHAVKLTAAVCLSCVYLCCQRLPACDS